MEKDRQKTTGLIGDRCKRSNALSLVDANGRGLTLSMMRRIRDFDGIKKRRAFTLFIKKLTRRTLGDLSGEGTPGPISNPAVKFASADGTWGATPWESRSLPRDSFLLIGLC